MPTIDINTQRNSGGIGNAWDFFDIQRVLERLRRVVAGDRPATPCRRASSTAASTSTGEYMARTNGDLDYDNWVLFFTGHGAAGGGSDLDQGDTRRDFRAHDVGCFVQDDWRIGRGLTVNAGLRYDIYGNFTETQRPHRQLLPARVAAALGVEPGFQVPGNAPFFQPGFTPPAIGLVVDPGTPIDLSQIHEAKYDSTVHGRLQQRRAAPRRRVAAVVCAEGRGARRLGRLLRADRRQLQARPAARGAVLHPTRTCRRRRTWPTRIRGSTSTRSRFR